MRSLLCASILLASAPASAEGDLERQLGVRLSGTEVKPRSDARLWWTPGDGAAIADVAIEDGARFARIEDTDPYRVRVRVDGLSVQLALYIDVTDLWPVASRPALMHPRPARALAPRNPEAPGIHLRPGARLELIRSGRRGPTREVAIEHGGLSGRGHVDSRAIGIDFKEAWKPAPDGAGARIEARAELRDRPGGKVVAELRGDPGEPLFVEILRERGEHALVVYEAHQSYAIGWVARDRLSHGVGPGGGGMGFGRGRGASITLPAGTALHDQKGGARVGVVIRAARPRVLERSGAWVRVAPWTEVGEIPVWARLTPAPAGSLGGK